MEEAKEETETEKLSDAFARDGTYLSLYLQGEVEDNSVIPIIDAILAANCNVGQRSTEDSPNDFEFLSHINLFVCSPGGDLTSTTQLLAAMDTSKIPIRTIGWGECLSAGSAIIMAGHERLVSEHITVMVHNASFIGTSSTQQHVSDKSQINMNRNIEKLMYNLYTRYTGKSLAYVKKHLMKASKDDVYMLAGDVIHHGLADALFTDYRQIEAPLKIDSRK